MSITVRQSPTSPGPQAASAPGGGSPLARGGVPLWLPLPFLLTGAGGAALFGLLLPFVASEALVTPELPHVLALVHIATLGWLTMTVMGASLQLAPVILVTPLRATRLVRAQYPLYALGVLLLVLGFWTAHPPLLAIGGSLIVFAVVHHALILWATIRRATTHPVTARYLAAAAGYLCLVVTVGLTLALNLQFGFLGAGTNHLLLAHVVLGIVGWLTSMLMGVSYALVPMFALVPNHNQQLARRLFPLLNGAVLGLAFGFGLSWLPLIVAAGIALVAAVALFAWDYWRMLRTRQRKSLETAQRHAAVAVAYLAVVVPAGVLVALLGLGRPPVLVGLGLAALVGWLGQSMIGYLYKIVPFLVWQTRYAPHVGRQRVPLLRDLISQRAARVSFWLINLGLPASILAAVLSWSVPLRLASALLGIGLVVAAGNIASALAPRDTPAR